MVLHELTMIGIGIRILIAFLVGGIIGMEREMNNHSAGLRTYMLVCVGSCLIMMTNQYVYQVFGTGDPLRMGAQVVSGIGFLGAGTIIVTRNNQIKGLTTAAGLWSAAGVGLAVGIGFYEAALIASAAIFIILTILHRWDDQMHQKAKVLDVYIELSKECPLGQFLRQLRKMGIEFEDLQLDREASVDEEVRALVATLKSKTRVNHKKLLSELRELDGVIYVEELS